MTDNKIKEIFEQIDVIIEESITDKPIPINQSRFLKRYKKLKERYKDDSNMV